MEVPLRLNRRLETLTVAVGRKPLFGGLAPCVITEVDFRKFSQLDSRRIIRAIGFPLRKNLTDRGRELCDDAW